MKRLFFIMLATMCLVGVGHAQQISLSNVEGLWALDTMLAGRPTTFEIKFSNTGTDTIVGFNNGFRFWTIFGGTRTAVEIDSAFFVAQAIKAGQDYLQGIVEFSVDGTGVDTLGIWAIGFDSVGMRPGYDEPMCRFTVTVDSTYEEEQFCIDSSWHPPQGEWFWSIGATGFAPAWSGPHCFAVHYEPDSDDDGIPDVIDNCPDDYNPLQEDTDGDGEGDACCCAGIRGNVNSDELDKVNVADLTYLVAYLFGNPTGPQPGCPNEGNVNGDVWELINIADLTYLVSYLFGNPNGDPPPDCP